ncbi:MAG: glycosyltransferase family 2 protein [Aggregatilineales bacterium]
MVATAHSVTLFYPAYNELESVEPMTRKALQVMPTVSDDFEILIIDDGSSDGSEKIADRLARGDPRIKVIHHQGNQGYGQALRTGFTSASKDLVMYTDCDEPADLWLIPEAVMHMADYDMLVGYRRNYREGPRRFAYSKVYNVLVRLLFDVRVRDINFSFKIIWRSALQKLHLASGSVFIDGELLAEAARYHLKIYQMPVQYLPRKHGESHFDSVRAATYTIEEIWAYWQRRRQEGATQPVKTLP